MLDDHDRMMALALWAPALRELRNELGAPVRVRFVADIPSSRSGVKTAGQAYWDAAAGAYVIELRNELDDLEVHEVFAHEAAHLKLGHLSRLRVGESEALHEVEADALAVRLQQKWGLDDL